MCDWACETVLYSGQHHAIITTTAEIVATFSYHGFLMSSVFFGKIRTCYGQVLYDEQIHFLI